MLPSGAEHVTEGVLDGSLTTAPRGTNGFGYDPIFVPAGAEFTTAEMSPADKDKISHRGRALRALAPIIAALLGSCPPATADGLVASRSRRRAARFPNTGRPAGPGA